MGCLLLLLLLLVSTVDGVASASCLSSQASILLRIKEDLHLSNGRLSSWGGNGNESDCCLWEGVECDSHTGYIIGLELDATIDIDIAGSRIPPALFDLHLLQHLDLSGCDFNSSTIPSQLGQLTHLTHLNLSRAWVSGKVPYEISNLSNLVALDLSPLLGGLEIQEDLEGFVGNFKQLKYLHLNFVIFNLRNSQEWGANLASALPNLRSLSLVGCDLEGSLTPHIFMLPHLQALDLAYNELQGELMPSFFPSESKLQSLRLSQNNLSGHLPIEIFELPHLKVLDVEGNDLLRVSLPTKLPTSKLEILNLGGIELLGDLFRVWIVNLTSLVQLELSYTNLSGSLPFSIANLTDLTHLDLSQTRLSGCIDSLLFANLTRLTYLDLSKNTFSGLLPSLPHSIRIVNLNNNNFGGPIPNSYNLLNIEKLDLSSNSFVGPFPFSLFQGPSFAQSLLEDLDLSNNKFDGYLDLGIFTNFKKLRSLSLSRNNLTVGIDNPTLKFSRLQDLSLASCNINQFPRFLRHQMPMDGLDLSKNRITEEIPQWLNTFGYLNISHNMITGFVPGTVLNGDLVDLSYNMLNSLPNSLSFNYLQSFSIKNNSVTGEIPAFLCNLTELGVVDFSNNKFSGQIPTCIFNMSLANVHLQNNQLQGQIPEVTGKARDSLDILDLSDNMLEGHIPKSLGHCKWLVFINLGKNKLSGDFPSWLSKLPKLSILVLSSNFLSGAINFSFDKTAFQGLLMLDISTNQFSGKFPMSLLLSLNAMKTFDISHALWDVALLNDFGTKWEVAMTIKGETLSYQDENLFLMNTIDLSNNYFEGEILEEIGDLKWLQALRISNNKLKGSIPKNFGGLQQLESLDLSHNHLSGEIPEELSKLNFLEYLNLSYNNLAGRIPQSPQFSTFDHWSFEGNPSLCGPPLLLACEANESTTSIPFLVLKQANEERMWKNTSVALGFGVGFGTAISFSFFLNNGRGFDIFWRRCYCPWA
ncbi:receptor-like protein 54 [Nymphaea colorata]|uniref:receptor-like protein 54 n=1 Tax=Nymphaea colorata TaxID=210225 RepID=UPI00129E8604|nr:receptor-like protein 54 [Nymphaea colorata]